MIKILSMELTHSTVRFVDSVKPFDALSEKAVSSTLVCIICDIYKSDPQLNLVQGKILSIGDLMYVRMIEGTEYGNHSGSWKGKGLTLAISRVPVWSISRTLRWSLSLSKYSKCKKFS